MRVSEVLHCLHHMFFHATDSNVLWQQIHLMSTTSICYHWRYFIIIPSICSIVAIFAALSVTKLPTLQPYLSSVDWIAVFVIPAKYSAVWLLPDVSVMYTSPSAVVVVAHTIGSLWILLQPSRAMLTVELRNFVHSHLVASRVPFQSFCQICLLLMEVCTQVEAYEVVYGTLHDQQYGKECCWQRRIWQLVLYTTRSNLIRNKMNSIN